ncbi:MAG TPA: hypothetical protein VHE35_08990 [Kofleriaceae bacterium]|nr:hypothetical protein [Kofleriaceae bacterium]
MSVRPHLRRATRPRTTLPLAAAAAIVGAAAAGAGCTDFATPAELTKPTILAVIAEPPIVAPGAQTELSVAVVDGTGVLMDLPARWSLVETYRGVPPMGTLTGSTYTAPDPIPTLPPNAPPIDSVQLEVDTSAGTLTAIKAVPVASVDAANPTIDTFTVGASDALAGPITVTHGATLDLDVVTDPPATADARYAWYSSVGDIEQYQSNPTTMIAADQAKSGWMFVVVRDGKGGVTWRGVAVTVE